MKNKLLALVMVITLPLYASENLLGLLPDIQKLHQKKSSEKLYDLIKNIDIEQTRVTKNDIREFNDIAYYLQKANMNKEAVVILKKVIAVDYYRVVAHYNLGDALWALGKKEEALEEYKLYVKQMRKKGKEKRIPNKILRLIGEKRISKFIPKGSVFLALEKGDLNRDAKEDAILVYENEEGDRPLLLLLGKDKENYVLKAQNKNIVSRAEAGGARGDPFDGIVIKNGYFSVHHWGGSRYLWSVITTFKYVPKKKNWFLHKEGGHTLDTRTESGVVEEVDKYLDTVKDFGVVAFEKYEN